MDAAAAVDDEQDQARLDAIADGLQTRDAYALHPSSSLARSLLAFPARRWQRAAAPSAPLPCS
jgi:hypothetical protein